MEGRKSFRVAPPLLNFLPLGWGRGTGVGKRCWACISCPSERGLWGAGAGSLGLRRGSAGTRLRPEEPVAFAAVLTLSHMPRVTAVRPEFRM